MNEAAEIPTKLLLHACCGPCSMEPVRLTREAGAEPVIYYANSNIHPAQEYAHRLKTLATWAKDEQLVVIEGPYDADAWETTVGRIGDAAHEKFGVIVHEANDSPLASSANDGSATEENAGLVPTCEESDGASNEHAPRTSTSPAEEARQARCRACYRMRFEETAQYAASHGFEAIGTTLSVSPYQYTAIIREELERAAAKAGVQARFVDYRPYYDNATRRSREAGMYRQNYCACRFSDEEAQVEREQRKQARKAAKEAEAAAHAEERAAEEAARKANRAEKAAYADKQARKRAILKQLREENRG